MKAITLLLSLTILIFSNLAAQIPLFDLAKYVRPTLNRKSLDMDLSFSGRQNNTFSTANNGSRLGGELFLWYQSFHNSPTAQKNTSISLTAAPYRNQSSTNVNQTRSHDLNGLLSVNSSYLKYSDKVF